MPDVKGYHKLNSSSFQDLITDLFNAKENTNTYTLLGRSGQKQHGIDIISDQKATVIQCKYKDDQNPEPSIVSSLKKELKRDVEQAAQSPFEFNHFILVSTHRHDAELQHYAIELRDELEYDFNISYIGWDEIRKWLIQFPEIYTRYFKSHDLPFIPVELVSIGIDEENCAWQSADKHENTFYRDYKSKKSLFPVFDFTFVNHLNRTIVLKSIHLWVKGLYSGLSGIPRPALLESSHTYQMKFQYGKENVLNAIPPLEIPKEQAFRFKLETINEYDGEPYPINDRNILYFEFEFSSGVKVTAPKVYLNTQDESNTIKILELA